MKKPSVKGKKKREQITVVREVSARLHRKEASEDSLDLRFFMYLGEVRRREHSYLRHRSSMNKVRRAMNKSPSLIKWKEVVGY